MNSTGNVFKPLNELGWLVGALCLRCADQLALNNALLS